MTNPTETSKPESAQADEMVTQEDRVAAADLIEAYWLGLGDQHDSMRPLVTSYRAGHTQGVWIRAFARHRVASTATLQASLDEARAEIARLREALEPFAEQADFYDECEQHRGGCPDDSLAGESPDLTVGDFRRARAALNQPQEPSE